MTGRGLTASHLDYNFNNLKLGLIFLDRDRGHYRDSRFSSLSKNPRGVNLNILLLKKNVKSKFYTGSNSADVVILHFGKFITAVP